MPYRLFGLSVESEFELPHIERTDEPAQVAMRRGVVGQPWEEPEHTGAFWETKGGRLLFWLLDEFRILVEGGDRITVEAGKDVTDETLVPFLLGTSMGAILHQRGILPLHGSAVTPDGKRAFAVAGLSGSGKSTTARALVARGCGALADDVCAIDLSDGATVLPGIPYGRLWADAMEGQGLNPEAHARVRPDIDKFVVPFADGFHREALPLAGIFMLAPGRADEVETRRLEGVGALKAVRNQTYRTLMVAGLGVSRQHFEACNRVAQSVPVYRIARPVRGSTVDDVAAAIEEVMGKE